MKLAVLQHHAVYHRVFASICWLKKTKSQMTNRPSRHITLEAGRGTPLKVGRHPGKTDESIPYAELIVCLV